MTLDQLKAKVKQIATKVEAQEWIGKLLHAINVSMKKEPELVDLKYELTSRLPNLK